MDSKQRFIVDHVEDLIRFALGEDPEPPQHELDCGVWDGLDCTCGADDNEGGNDNEARDDND